jgi:hypothetical protein
LAYRSIPRMVRSSATVSICKVVRVATIARKGSTNA